MNTDADGIAAANARLPHERLLIEIATCDARLHLGLSSDLAPAEQRFQGGLAFVRGLVIEGRIAAPARLHDTAIRLRLSPFGSELEFGDEGLDEVGQVYFPQPTSDRADLRATLLLPESALPIATICLSSIWRYAVVWTFDPDEERASVSAFSFSATRPEEPARTSERVAR